MPGKKPLGAEHVTTANMTAKGDSQMPGESKMCATLETIRYKPGRLQDSIDLMKELQSELQAMAGRKHTISVWNDGEDIEYVLSIWESPEAKAVAAAQVDALGTKFGDMFEAFESIDLQNVWYMNE